jgi:RNA polymerase sigma-70 factor (ECF subfamily)
MEMNPAHVWRTYSGRVEGLARRLTGSAEDAAEVAQDVALALVAHLAGFQGRSAVWTWLRAITVNACREVWRRRRRRREVPLGQPAGRGPDPGARLQLAELRQAVRTGTARLQPTERLVLLLARAGWNAQLMAAELKLSLPCVKSRLLRARLALREHLSPVL